MSTASRILKNTGFLYIRIAITMIVAFWTTRIVLNALGEDDFGVYSLVGGMVTLLWFLNASLSGATQRFINIAEGENDLEKKKIIFNNSLTLHSILAVGLIILFIIIGVIAFEWIIKIPPSSYFAAKCVYACMICTTVISVLNVPYEAEINAHEDMGVYAVVGISDAALKLAIAFTINYVESNRLILYGILLIIVPLITLIILRVFCHRHYEECTIHPIRYFRKDIIKRLASFAGWNFVNTASGMVTQSGLNLVINHFFGVVLNAAQGITNQVGNALMNLSSNVEKALNPVIVKKEGAHERDKMLYFSLLGCRMIFFIFSFFSLFLIAEMSPVLHLWLKEVPGWTAVFCQLQLIRVALELLTRGVHVAIMAQGNIKWYCIFKSITNILPLLLTTWVFYMGMPPYWMYIIWIFAWSILGGGVSLWFGKRNIGLTYQTYWHEVMSPICKAILPPICLIIFSRIFLHDLWYGVCFTTAAVTLYGCLAYKIIFTSDERLELRKILNRFTHKIH